MRGRDTPNRNAAVHQCNFAPTLDSIDTYVLISATSAPNRTFTAGKGAENHRRVERESVHTFYAFDAAINSYKKRSAGGVLNRADVGDLTSRENGEIDCSRPQGDGTRHKPKGFRAKRRPPTGQGERFASVRGMRSRSLAPTSKPGGRRRDAASGPNATLFPSPP